MIVVMKPDSTPHELDAVMKRAALMGAQTHPIYGESRTVVALVVESNLPVSADLSSRINCTKTGNGCIISGQCMCDRVSFRREARFGEEIEARVGLAAANTRFPWRSRCRTRTANTYTDLFTDLVVILRRVSAGIKASIEGQSFDARSILGLDDMSGIVEALDT